MYPFTNMWAPTLFPYLYVCVYQFVGVSCIYFFDLLQFLFALIAFIFRFHCNLSSPLLPLWVDCYCSCPSYVNIHSVSFPRTMEWIALTVLLAGILSTDFIGFHYTTTVLIHWLWAIYVCCGTFILFLFRLRLQSLFTLLFYFCSHWDAFFHFLQCHAIRCILLHFFFILISLTLLINRLLLHFSLRFSFFVFRFPFSVLYFI